MGLNKVRVFLSGLLVLAATLGMLATPVMATHIYLDQIHGSYSLQLATTEATIKFGGTNGAVNIHTAALGYTDNFLMNAGGDFSGCQFMSNPKLYREFQLAGGGSVSATTHPSSGTDVVLTFNGDQGSFTQDIDFGSGADSSPMNIQMLLTAAQAWVMFASDYDQEALRIESFAQAYGLSNGEASVLFGLWGELARFGYSASEVVHLAHTKGVNYLRDLLAMLRTPRVSNPIDKAAEKFGIPWDHARGLFREFKAPTFVTALSTSHTYKDFVAKLEGFDMKVWAGSLLSGTKVMSGDEILAAFKLFHPVTHEQLFNPGLLPYANVAQILPNGKLKGLAGYYSYIEFHMDEKTGVYYARIKTAIDEKHKLEPGNYYVFIVLRNPGNDMYSTIKAEFTVTS